MQTDVKPSAFQNQTSIWLRIPPYWKLLTRSLAYTQNRNDGHRAITEPSQRDLRHAAAGLFGDSFCGGDDAVGALLFGQKIFHHVAGHSAVILAAEDTAGKAAAAG